LPSVWAAVMSETVVAVSGSKSWGAANVIIAGT
jgi:hypothetical protein